MSFLSSYSAPFGTSLSNSAPRRLVAAAMRPESIGTVPPALVKMKRISGLRDSVPLNRRLMIARVTSCGVSAIMSGTPETTLPQHSCDEPTRPRWKKAAALRRFNSAKTGASDGSPGHVAPAEVAYHLGRILVAFAGETSGFFDVSEPRARRRNRKDPNCDAIAVHRFDGPRFRPAFERRAHGGATVLPHCYSALGIKEGRRKVMLMEVDPTGRWHRLGPR